MPDVASGTAGAVAVVVAAAASVVAETEVSGLGSSQTPPGVLLMLSW